MFAILLRLDDEIASSAGSLLDELAYRMLDKCMSSRLTEPTLCMLAIWDV